MLEIPFNPSISADQKFQVLIPEQMVITLRLLWNGRASAWFMTVSSDSGELGQFRLVERFPILREHKALSPIKGDIIVLPLSEGGPWRFLGPFLDFARRIGGMGGRKCSGVGR